MTQDRHDGREELVNGNTSTPKPYSPPAVTWEESLDRGAMLAAACGKNESLPNLQCQSAPAS